MKFCRAVFGSGFVEASSSLLQKEDEFRKAGHLLVGAAWVYFDEIKPHSNIQEEIFKLPVSGGLLILRKNHEAETHEASRQSKFPSRAEPLNGSPSSALCFWLRKTFGFAFAFGWRQE